MHSNKENNCVQCPLKENYYLYLITGIEISLHSICELFSTDKDLVLPYKVDSYIYQVFAEGGTVLVPPSDKVILCVISLQTKQ